MLNAQDSFNFLVREARLAISEFGALDLAILAIRMISVELPFFDYLRDYSTRTHRPGMEN